MSHYVIRKTGKGWSITSQPLWHSTPVTIGTYKSRKAATLAARLLAGWRGTVTEVRS